MRRDHKNHIGSPCRPVFAFPFVFKSHVQGTFYDSNCVEMGVEAVEMD